VKWVIFELGGKSVNIVFVDVDIDAVVVSVLYVVFDNVGQDCCVRSRILVEWLVYDEFFSKLELVVIGLWVFDLSDEMLEMGLLILV